MRANIKRDFIIDRTKKRKSFWAKIAAEASGPGGLIYREIRYIYLIALVTAAIWAILIIGGWVE